jgi:hypothetical protein
MKSVVFLLGLVAAFPALSNPADLVQARSLRCEFGPGATADLRSASPSFELSPGGMRGPMDFDSISIAQGTARFLGNNASVDVGVAIYGSTMNFFEFTTNGSFIVTTVFPNQTQTGRFPAVMSRHVSIVGQPLPSQWAGSCWIR